MTTALGLLLAALGLVGLYAAWSNLRPDDVILQVIDTKRKIRRLDTD